jgi:hypothetical protein
MKKGNRVYRVCSYEFRSGKVLEVEHVEIEALGKVRGTVRHIRPDGTVCSQAQHIRANRSHQDDNAFLLFETRADAENHIVNTGRA